MNACFRNTLVTAAAAVAFAGTAQAQFSTGPIPDNNTIFQSGLQWAWAYPLPASASGFTLAFQSAFGWRLPTPAELASAPLAVAFLFPGANVPFDGTDPLTGATFNARNAVYENAASAGACATPYFSTIYYHCDWFNGLGQLQPGDGPNVWAGMPGSVSYSDQLVVRDAVSTIPEPSTLVLFGNGLALIGFVAYRRRA